MKLVRTLSFFVVAGALVAACGGRRGHGDSVAPNDSGVRTDGALPGDGSMPGDGSLPGDGGLPDIGLPDLNLPDGSKGFCGDFSTGPGEQCDSGGSDTSGCDYDCTFSSCGDFHTNFSAGEDCDEGPSGSTTCSVDCTSITPSFCGDGVVNAGEGCDDGSTFSSDGCSSTCVVESGWMCSGSPSFCTRTTGRTINQTASPFATIVDYSTVATTETSTMSITGAACTIASITVDVNITHSYIGDLTVDLQSPGGTIVNLHNLSGTSSVNIVGTYGSGLTEDGPGVLIDLTGVSAIGTWTMRVADHAASDTGTFNTWALHIVCS